MITVNDSISLSVRADQLQEQERSFSEMMARLKASGYANLRPLLPALYTLKGKPYSLNDHFPFEPFFAVQQPKMLTVISGRQVSKSSSISSAGVLRANTIPFFTLLYITPQYELTRRLSNNYVREFVTGCRFADLWRGPDTENNVLQRSFSNRSKLQFTFTGDGGNRARGISASQCNFDEVQDMDPEDLPVIEETMAASEWGVSQYTGTPKTLDGALEDKWQTSSMAQWLMPCPRCNYENVPALSHDLDEMIGPWSLDISEERPGVICAKCQRPLSPRGGRWVHAIPEKAFEHAGYHMPQLLFPMHYAKPGKWKDLLTKKASLAPNVFYNEVCGESFDLGAKLVTITELRAAAVLHENTLSSAMASTESYRSVILSVDWGGGGQQRTSYTAAAVLGLRGDGKVDVLYGWRSLTPHDWPAEVDRAMDTMRKFRCTHFVHDYNGAGEGRQELMRNMGIPMECMVPVSYCGALSGALIRFTPYNDHNGQRPYYKIDKPRSLQLTCSLLKYGQLRFFKYDHNSSDDPGLLHDFLTLIEDKVDGTSGRDRYNIIRDTKSKRPDDFAQAVNMGAMWLFHLNEAWPDLTRGSGLTPNPNIDNSQFMPMPMQDYDDNSMF